MRWLLLCLVVCSNAWASPIWQSNGSTVLGSGSASELESDGSVFVVGRPYENNGTGMLAFVEPGTSQPSNLHPANSEQGSQFGYRVAIDGNLMAVTESRLNILFPVNGPAVRIYERLAGNWSMTYLTTAPYSPIAEWQFGFGLAVADDRVFIGAPGLLSQRGVVYVYERTGEGTWPLYPAGSVFAYDGDSFDGFGRVIAAEGDWLAVGASQMERDPATESQGAVYLFRRVDGVYVQAQRLMAPIPQNRSYFGHAIDLDAGTLVVGAVAEDDPDFGPDVGAAYVFTLVADRWELQQRLTAGDGAQLDSFGDGVAIRGDTLVVAASSDDNEFGVNAGTAYAFERVGGIWQESGRIAPAKPPVAISQNAIARLDYVAPNSLVRYYPTSDRIFGGSFED